MSAWNKIIGTQTGRFILGFLGVQIKNEAGDLAVRTNDDTAYAPISVAETNHVDNVSGNRITIVPPASLAGDYTLTLPADDGSPAQVLTTDGSGVLSWTTSSVGGNSWVVDSTDFTFGSGATVPAFTLPANAVVDTVSIVVDTPFDGTPTLSVGVNGGSASKYAGSGDSLLSLGDRFDIPNQSTANVASEDLELAFSAGGATVGAGRVLITYAIPT